VNTFLRGISNPSIAHELYRPKEYYSTSEDFEMQAREVALIIDTIELTKRDRLIFDLRYGLNNNHSHSMQWIAEKTGISNGRVSEIIRRHLYRMQRDNGLPNDWPKSTIDTPNTIAEFGLH
jgi:DNA-directed RNA polymerase sigma subunit (sigma70/sigma32)